MTQEIAASDDTGGRSASDETHGRARTAPVRVGPYRIEGELGRGGMGVVHRAFDERLHRHVALKALPADLAADPVELARLEAEARALARVQHPNVAAIYGLEESGGTCYLVLELVEGETLRARLDRGALTVPDSVSIGLAVADGLGAMHRKHLVHRDIKPGNVMITSDGSAKILDFGIAKDTAASTLGSPTRSEAIIGTPGYMSPEQLHGRAFDARSDAWAWGCLVFECLAGRAPFDGPTITDRTVATLHREPPWERLPPSTPQALAELLHSCLTKDPSGRPASMEDLRRELEHAREARQPAASKAARHSLPTERDAFVGRAAELDALAGLVDSGHRLVSVLGLGGTGKTRLVVRHAWTRLDEFPGGAWFCDLSEARSLDGIVQAVARALAVPLGRDEPVAQLGHAIAGRGRCLVILDNFEQVSRHAAGTLGRWLDRCSEASFVVTTREVLGLAGEAHLPLAPMGRADSTALFVARAKATKPDFDPTGEDREVIERLVAELDDLPLAIELAAARVRVMPVQQLLARMSERFRLLSGSGTRLDRQATLRAALDWSWDLLSSWEKHALAQVSVFDGGLSLESAEAVLDLSQWPDAPWTVDAVQALADKSLVRRVDGDRLEPLVTVQEYAAEKLRVPLAFEGSGPDAERAAQRRHGAHFAERGTREALDALDARDGLPRRLDLARDLDNLVAACRRAVERSDTATAVSTLAASWAVLGLQGPFAVGVELGHAVAAMPDLDGATRARALSVLGQACAALGRLDEAREHSEAELAIHRALGNRGDEGLALGSLGLLHLGCSRMDEARRCWEAALAIHRAIGNRSAEAATLGNLGLLHSDQGRMVEATKCYEAALAGQRAAGNRRSEGNLLGNLGTVHLQQGRMDDARRCYEAALAIHREVGNRGSEGRTIANLGNLHWSQGRADEAARCYLEALSIQRNIGDRVSEATNLGNLASLHAAQDRLDEARACFDLALPIAREVGNRGSEANILANLGCLNAEQDRMDEARRCYDEALLIVRELGDRRLEGAVDGNLGALHAQAGRFDEARAVLVEGEALLRGIGPGVELAKHLCIRAETDHLAGDAASARTALDEAAALARELGASDESGLGRDVARVRALLDAGSRPPGPVLA